MNTILIFEYWDFLTRSILYDVDNTMPLMMGKGRNYFVQESSYEPLPEVCMDILAFEHYLFPL